MFSPTGCEVMLKALGWLDEGTGKARKLKRRIDDVGSNGQGEKRGSDVFVACIGPTTREYLEREFGFHVDVCAEAPSPEGVGEGIRRFMVERGT